jgi:hypothetical protein
LSSTCSTPTRATTPTFQTSLEYLLSQEDVDRIVLVVVPRDATAFIHEDHADAALAMIERSMAAEVIDAGDVDFKAFSRGDGPD